MKKVNFQRQGKEGEDEDRFREGEKEENKAKMIWFDQLQTALNHFL